MRYLAVYDSRVLYVTADTPGEAALMAARTMPSVGGLRKGATISLYPADFVIDVKVQYEHPDADPTPGLDDRIRDYGEAVVVDEFQDFDQTKSIFD